MRPSGAAKFVRRSGYVERGSMGSVSVKSRGTNRSLSISVLKMVAA